MAEVPLSRTVYTHILKSISYRPFHNALGYFLAETNCESNEYFFTSGEAKLLMVLMFPSTQAVKKYCFLPNNTTKAVVIPHSQAIPTLLHQQSTLPC